MGWDQVSPVSLATMPAGQAAGLILGHASWEYGAIFLLLAGIGGVLFVTLLLPVTNRRLLATVEETRLWDFLPFDGPVRGGLRMRDGALTAAVRIAGLDLTAANLEEVEAKRRRRRQWFSELNPDVVYRIFQMRRRVVWRNPEGTPPTKRAGRIIEKWFGQFQDSFELETVVVLEVAGATSQARHRLETAVQQTLSILEPFGASSLEIDGKTDPLLAFWGRQINPANAGRLVLGRKDARMSRMEAARLGYGSILHELEAEGTFGSGLSERLAGGWVDSFPDGTIRHSAGVGEDVFAFIVAVPLWGDGTAEALNRDLLRVRGEICIVHRISPIRSDDAKEMVKMAANNARSSEDDDLTVAEQKAIADERLSPISTQKEAIARYETWVICYGRTRLEAMQTERQVTQVMRDFQLRPRVVPQAEAEHYWFGQFPTYNQPLRACNFFTSNVADLVLFENVAQGSASCDWGTQPVLPLRTQFGTTFGFVPHQNEQSESLAHMLVIGQPGSGKTKFLQLVATAASRFENMHVMWFDRDFASAAWALAIGADYFDFFDGPHGLKTAKLNPCFDLDPADPADQQALRGWFALLCEDDSDEAMKQYGSLIEFIHSTPRKNRTLANLAPIAIGTDSPLRAKIARWVDPRQHGSIWQSDIVSREGISLSRQINLFNMTSILDDERLAPPVVSYLWYRHRRAVKRAGGAPSLVVVDETRPLLQSPVMRRELLRELREGRRRRESVCLVFQEPTAIGAIGGEDFTATTRGSFGTQVLFPISGSREQDWSYFDLTPSERAFVMGLSRVDCRYPALIRKPISKVSVIVDLDQACLGEDELFMRGSQSFALAAHEARRSSPADPATEYLVAAQKIAATISNGGEA